MVDVLINGGGWTTNIGNAFLDYGCMGLLRQINVDFYLTSPINRWVSSQLRRGITDLLYARTGSMDNVFNSQYFIDNSYVVQTGACLSKSWMDVHGEVLYNLSKKGKKIIFLGAGISDSAHSDSEIAKTRKILEKINPYAIISRDSQSHSSFNDLAKYSYDGIDCAFWLPNYYEPVKLDISNYCVINFDKSREPNIFPLTQYDLVIRTHHSLWLNFPISKYPSMFKYYYGKNNVLISELPEDYLAQHVKIQGIFRYQCVGFDHSPGV